jgi:hypothetical protein
MRLSGHKDIETHMLYMSPLTPVAVPLGAIPKGLVPKKGPADEETSDFAAE